MVSFLLTVNLDNWLGLLGSMAPCVLYGSNVERLGSAPGTFANHCVPYTGLYLIGKAFFGWNFLAPWFSYPSRTAIRRKFNLEASYFSTTSPPEFLSTWMSFWSFWDFHKLFILLSHVHLKNNCIFILIFLLHVKLNLLVSNYFRTIIFFKTSTVWL